MADSDPNPQEPDEMTLQAMFNLLTSSEQDVADLFRDISSSLNRAGLQKMASWLTTNSRYFMAIAKTEHGSKRLQKLLGKSVYVDALFCKAILSCFIPFMTDKHASHVAVRAMTVFDQPMKEVMFEYMLRYALNIACGQYGCIALNNIIIDLDHPYYKTELLGIVAHNALFLSNDVYGNFVIQHVLKLNYSRSTHNISVRLRGHCVDLSFKKHGSYIVEGLLKATEESMLGVVVELLECEGDRLMRLARSEFGNYVVAKALRITDEMRMVRLFWGLVHKLMPYVHLLRKSRGSNIAAMLESL